MELGVGRDPSKQALIESVLDSPSVKGSAAHTNIENKIRSGIYRTNKGTRNKNRMRLQNRRSRKITRLTNGKVFTLKAPEAEIKKIDAILPLMEDESPVIGSESNIVPEALQITPLRPVPEEEFAIPQPGCNELFDPCTKEPVSSLEALEKRIREIKKQRDMIPVGLYGLTNDTSNYDFLTKVFIDPKVSLDDMVSFRLSTGGQVGSDIYEVLSRLFVFFGGIENVNPRKGGNYKFMKKIEGDAPHVYYDSIDALKRMKCKATRAMGISDITLTISRNDTRVIKPDDPYCEVDCDIEESINIKTYLISVKWYKDEKNAEHYDLEKLFTASQKITTDEQKPLGIIVFLKSKKDFEIAHNRSYRQYTRDIAKTFFGWNEDVKPFLEEKRKAIFELASISGISPLEALENQYFTPNAKPILSLQLHQDIIVKGVCDRLEISDDNLYLIGVLPRGGKTFIAGGIIREYLRRTKIPNLSIFWLTAAPNETMTQVRDELLNRFQDFSDFEFIEVKSVLTIRKLKPHSVFFCSSQLLIATQKKAKIHTREREFLKNLINGSDRLGLVFFDEAHKTGTGDKTKEEVQKLINTYSQDMLPFIFLTATYYNILLDYQIQKPNTFIWDYTDVLITRSLATETEQEDAIHNLQKRFDKEIVDNVIETRKANNETLETMAKAYIGFPELYFITADFEQETLDRFAEQGKYRPDSGFSLSSIFAIKQGTTIVDVKTEENKIRKDAYKIFENLTNPKNIISLLTPKETFDIPDVLEIEGGKPLTKEEGSIIEPSLLGRINKMSSDAKSRFRLDEQPTMLMFMPTGGIGTNIFYLLCAWASLLMTHKWWRENYEIACIVSEENIGADAVSEILHMGFQASENIHIISKNPKANIMTLERKLHCQTTPKGLLILAGEKLSMGISLPCTDVVFLFNEKKSPDDIIQKMYRALTPSPGKKSAFVVDLNPVRTLAALYGYTRASHESLNTSSQILDIIYDTYSWDSDIFEYNLMKGSHAKPLSFQDKLRELFEKAEKDPSNEYRINEDIGGFEKKIGENIRRGMNSEFISKIAEHFSSTKLEETLTSIGLRKGSKITLKNGKLIIRGPPNEREEGEELSDTEPNEGKIEIVIDNYIGAIVDIVYYLAATSNASTLEGALQEYESDLINEGGSSLRRNVLNLIRSRTGIQEGEGKEILFKILTAAVKNFAFNSSERVFRQMKGKIEERLLRKDKILKIIHARITPRKKQKEENGEVFTPIELVEKMLSHLPKNVWKNPDLTWLDPANGIGNFPIVVFYKLDEGLKEWESSEKKRRKHIIENMLYMLEKESSNNRIARKMFASLCEGCSANILSTDSLKITSEKLKSLGWPTKYDIIIGNPPYQTGGTHQSGTTIWPKFIEHYTNFISINGYMLFINGQGWREFANEDILKLMKTMNLLVINIMGKAFPRINYPVDYFLLQNNTEYKTTEIINNELSISQNINIKYLQVIPNFGWDIFERWSKNKLKQLQVIRSNETSSTKKIFNETKTTLYKYPIIMNINGGGHKIKYSNVKHSLQDNVKVLTAFGSSLYPFVDSKGEYGISENVFAIVCKTISDAEVIKKYLENPIVKNLLESLKIGTYAIKNKLLSVMPDPLEFKSNSLEKNLLLTDKDTKMLEKIKVVTEKDKESTEGGSNKRNFTRKIKRT